MYAGPRSICLYDFEIGYDRLESVMCEWEMLELNINLVLIINYTIRP